MLPYVWQTGIGRGWPLSAAEEADFTSWLPSPARSTPTRYALTTALLCVREGANPATLSAAGVAPHWPSVAASWTAARHAFREAHDAWLHIARAPESPTAVADYADQAARLAHLPVSRIAAAHADGHLAADHVAEQLLNRIADTCAHVTEVEAAMAAASGDRAAELGCELFNPYTADSLWAAPLFIPSRLGQLTPLRVDLLLDGHPDFLDDYDGVGPRRR